MSAASYGRFITAQHLKDLGWCMISLATIFTIARFTIRIIKRRFWLLEDCVVVLAWACHVALCAGYIKVTDTVYRISAVGDGEAPPYPTLDDDIHFLLAVFFPGTLLLWCCLWLVKWSLLLNCRRLVERKRGYIIVWWCIAIFCILTFIGCVISELRSCRSLHDWFTPGLCSTTRDARAALISLFYAFSADMASDLMIIVFPIRVLWGLQISRARKSLIMAVFAVALLCVCTSIVRVVQIQRKAGRKQPSPAWLAVWAMVEAGISVIVACLPSFGLLLPSKRGIRPSSPKSGERPMLGSRRLSPQDANGLTIHASDDTRTDIETSQSEPPEEADSLKAVLVTTKIGIVDLDLATTV